MYQTKKFKTWNGFQTFARTFSEDWIFRGQSDAGWLLKTSWERSGFSNQHPDIEFDFLMDFQRGARNFLAENDIPSNLIEWLALMQHHGAPTRFLDFTRSIYIALHFAFENVDSDSKSSIAIWAVDIRRIRDSLISFLELRHDEDFEKIRNGFSDQYFEKTKRTLTEKDFEKLFIQNDRSCILPVEPLYMNRRYFLQQSVFVSTGNSYDSFMDQLQFLDEHIKQSVFKIELPTSLRNEVLRELQKMNINKASLFPDLDGYSSALTMKYKATQSSCEYVEQSSKFIRDK